MIHAAQCPHCKAVINKARVEQITIDSGLGSGTNYKGVTYSCPWCKAVLTVSMDQIALNADLMNRLEKLLGRG
jgi:hypothetical protein